MRTDLKKCEYCGAIIPVESTTCPMCNADLTTSATNGKTILKIIAFIIPVIGFVLIKFSRRENDRQSYVIPTWLGTMLWVICGILIN